AELQLERWRFVVFEAVHGPHVALHIAGQLHMAFPTGLACVASAFQIAQVGVAEHAAPELVMITQTDTRIVQAASRVLRAHVHVWAELGLGMVQGIFSAEVAAKPRLAERATPRRFLDAHGAAVMRM